MLCGTGLDPEFDMKRTPKTMNTSAAAVPSIPTNLKAP
jgi:hypothetical protein